MLCSYLLSGGARERCEGRSRPDARSGPLCMESLAIGQQQGFHQCFLGM